MKVKWLGHSCFKITSSADVSIVFDPHDPNYTGLPLLPQEADVVVISHSHGDHSAIHMVNNYKKLIDSEGVSFFNGVKIETLSSFHDPELGKLRGDNLISIVEMDGIRLAHFGDIGQNLSANLIEKILPIDIIFIPVGGIYTIDSEQALEFKTILSPKITVPMHYYRKELKFELNALDDFLKLLDKESIVFLNTDEIIIDEFLNNPKTIVFNKKK